MIFLFTFILLPLLFFCPAVCDRASGAGHERGGGCRLRRRAEQSAANLQ
jgi:hypothetical protein